jgi:hypothetical protein
MPWFSTLPHLYHSSPGPLTLGLALCLVTVHCQSAKKMTTILSPARAGRWYYGMACVNVWVQNCTATNGFDSLGDSWTCCIGIASSCQAAWRTRLECCVSRKGACGAQVAKCNHHVNYGNYIERYCQLHCQIASCAALSPYIFTVFDANGDAN